MIGSHSSISAGAGGTGVGPPSGGVHGHAGADEGGGRGIYIISTDSTLSGGLNPASQRRTTATISTASESLEMMTTASSSSYSRGSRPAVPRSYSDVIPEDVRGGHLPGAIPEDLEIGGPPVVKQELRDDTSSDSGSRTSVFSDYLPCGLTRFHFSLCFGMVGFVVFWLGLLLRIYLPH